MKTVKCVFVVLVSFISTLVFAQGTSCLSPFSLILDSVSRNYTISSSNGNSSHCTAPEFSGTGKITVFTITTNASASCVLLNLSTSPVQAAEVTFYTGCSGGGNCQGPVDANAVCFSDGAGYWAPAESYTLSPNTTYYLRIWTPGTGTLTLSATHYTPPNNLCSGATNISPVATNDNNACNKPSTEVVPLDLCAFSLENTAFYTYYVENDGTSSIQLNNINCDNSASGSSNGFQVGFFLGACGSLTKINCVTNSGGSVTASTGWQPSGTKVTVAIDGTAGSNCSYTITAFNAMVLPVTVKYFMAWKRPDANRLTWVTTSETGFSHFEIERSIDGVNFVKIGTRAGNGESDKEIFYSFDDYSIGPVQHYRLKYVNAGGKYTYSYIIRVNRNDIAGTKILFSNRVTSQLSLRIIDLPAEKLTIKVINNSGREMNTQHVRINPGENSFNLNTSSIPAGFYYLMLSGESYRKTMPFIKF